MTLHTKTRLGIFRVVSFLILVAFVSNQIIPQGLANAAYVNEIQETPLPETSEISKPLEQPNTELSPETSIDFLQNDSPLSPPTLDVILSPSPVILSEVPAKQRSGSATNFGGKDLRVNSAKNLEDPSPAKELWRAQDDTDHDYERYDFEDALDLLRPEYASAVIVKNLSEEDLKSLLDLDFEVAIVILKGELVLFTTGREEKIGITGPAKKLLEEASFISHTHVTEVSQSGPSAFDLDHAVNAPLFEYVVTQNGAYAYNNLGSANGGDLYSLNEYLNFLNQALVTPHLNPPPASRGEAGRGDQVLARSYLNRFIREMDLLNEAPPLEQEPFRRSETEPGLVGYWNFEGGTATDQSGTGNDGTLMNGTAITTDHPAVNFTNTGSLSFDGMNDYVDMGNAPSLQLTGAMSVSVWVYVNSFGSGSATNSRFVSKSGLSGQRGWELNLESATGKVRFAVSPDGSTTTLVNAPSPTVTGQWVHYVGTYEPGVALRIYVDGVLNNSNTVGIPSSQYNTANNVWMGGRTGCSNCYLNGLIDDVRLYNRALSQAEVLNLAQGNLPDYTVPTGSIDINSGAAYTNSTSVTLNLSAADTGSGIDKMSFSTDNQNWSVPEAYGTTHPFTLPTGDGSKTVSIKYYDKVGNVSSVYSKSIILDTVPPTGTIKIDNDAASTNSTTVTLNLTGADLTSGVAQMRFSTDGVNWTDWETFNSTKSNFILPTGDGLKTVYVEFKDNADLVAQFSDQITLTTTPAPGTVTPDPTLTSANLTSFSGSPRLILMDGSSSNTQVIQQSPGQSQLSYDVTQAGSKSGTYVSFDNPTTTTVEVGNLSTLTDLIVGISGPSGSQVKFEVEDSLGATSEVTLINLNTTMQYYKISKTLFTGIDWTKVKRFTYSIDDSLTTVSQGTLTIQTKILLYHISSASTLPDAPVPMVLEGSTSTTYLNQFNPYQITLNYDVSPASSFSGSTFSFDNVSTQGVETGDISQGNTFTVGLVSGNSSLKNIKVEIEYLDGTKSATILSNISPTTQYYTLQKSQFLGIDWTQVKRVNFIVERSFLTSNFKSWIR
ncbi:MAG: LamG domain-containing protein, partial [Candidatus Omnitrophica bacterium]|nr:LamG domain-containing protein [Candidatus Omnitrophota bacterium]